MIFLIGLLSEVSWFCLTIRVGIHLEFIVTYGVSVRDH